MYLVTVKVISRQMISNNKFQISKSLKFLFEGFLLQMNNGSKRFGMCSWRRLKQNSKIVRVWVNWIFHCTIFCPFFSTEIMPKIVYVLEQLETLAERHEVDQEKLASLMIEKEKYLIYSNRDQAIQRQLEEVENVFLPKTSSWSEVLA